MLVQVGLAGFLPKRSRWRWDGTSRNTQIKVVNQSRRLGPTSIQGLPTDPVFREPHGEGCLEQKLQMCRVCECSMSSFTDIRRDGWGVARAECRSWSNPTLSDIGQDGVSFFCCFHPIFQLNFTCQLWYLKWGSIKHWPYLAVYRWLLLIVYVRSRWKIQAYIQHLQLGCSPKYLLLHS